MIAFNFNIHFQDEPSLNDRVFDDTRQSFLVKEDKSSFEKELFTIISDYVVLSDRRVKYYASSNYSNDDNILWGIEIEDVVFFSWNNNQQILNYKKLLKYKVGLLEFWTLHTLLPIIFTIEKRFNILHVGSIDVEGIPIVISAPSFGGKSTLVDYFIKQGHALISDDTIGIVKREDCVYAVPSYPYHRPFRSAETLGYKVDNWKDQLHPVKIIYKLNKDEANCKITIEELKGIEKFKVFHFSTFINFDYLKVNNFKLVSEMSKSIAVYSITVPWTIRRISEVYEAITKHTKILQSANML